MPTLLGLDVGTQGLKAVLFEPGRGVVAKASVPLRTLGGLPPGYSEQHPADWLAAAREALGRLRAEPGFADVCAIGVSGQQHGLVALDAAGDVLRPAILWNDVRCAVECREILDAVGGTAAAHRDFGLAALPPGFTAGKLRWVFRHEPAVFAQTKRVLLPHDYLNLWLTGRAAAEAGDASGTGWLDVRNRRYAEPLVGATAPGTADLLAPLLAPGEACGTLRPELAAELGLDKGVLVAAGAGAHKAAALGAGAVAPGIAVLSLGTSGTVFAHADAPVCDPDGEIAPFCDSAGGWLPLGCTMNATVATEAVRSLSGMELDAFEAAVAGVAPGADGVLCVPFFTGERSPDLPTATGSFLGLRPNTMTQAHLARAAMEGATLALGRLLDRLRALDVRIDELRLTGGGSHSPTWQRIVAAVGGVPVRAGVDADAAAVGAAVQALWTWRRDQGEANLTIQACRDELHLDRNLADVEATQEDRDRYAEVRAAYDRTVDALIPTYPTP
ncbi:MAG: xylulokinase [Planctomycetota bacterium]